MDNEQDPLLNREDALKAENTFLKLKLGLEHGMQMTEISPLPPDVENQWLKSVYAFEQQFKDSQRTTVYEYIGKPDFRKWDTLSTDELATELDRIELLLAKNNLELDCICKYEKAVIYKFITEELFAHEIDDMRIPGMTYHFIYEEFHPNHDRDLRQDSEYFVNALFTRSWDPDFDIYKLAERVLFSNIPCDRATMSVIIKTFQDANRPLQLERFNINEVAIDPALTEGIVRASLKWSSGGMEGSRYPPIEGDCDFSFVRTDEAWSLATFHIPGFSRSKQ